MTTMNNRLAALALGLLAAAVASPSLAQLNDHLAPRNRLDDGHVSAARAAALRECTGKEQQFAEYNWGVTEIQVYRACMAEHGQPE